MVQRTLFPLNHPKLFGNENPPEKSNSEPLSSMRLRNATTKSIRKRVNLSTMSVRLVNFPDTQLVARSSNIPAQVI